MISRRPATRTDNTGDRMTERVNVGGPGLHDSLGDVWKFVLKAAGDETPLVHDAFISWTRPATPEEKQEFLDTQVRHEARTEKWEREMYARLKEKFG